MRTGCDFGNTTCPECGQLHPIRNATALAVVARGLALLCDACRRAAPDRAKTTTRRQKYGELEY
jgi:hypothetical protein